MASTIATCSVCELHAESTFKIEGMDCREEVALIERRFKNLRGVEAFNADLMGQRLHVKYDAAKLSASAISPICSGSANRPSPTSFASFAACAWSGRAAPAR